MEIEDSWEMSFDWGGMGLIEDFANIFLSSKGRRGKLEIWKRKIEKVFRKKNFRIGIYFETIIMSKSTGEEKKEFSSLHFFLFSFLEKLLEYGWSSVNGEFYILMNEHFQ